jgi:hypothetical protein
MTNNEFRQTIHKLLSTVGQIHNDLQFTVELPTVIEDLDFEEFDQIAEKLQSIAEEF